MSSKNVKHFRLFFSVTSVFVEYCILSTKHVNSSVLHRSNELTAGYDMKYFLCDTRCVWVSNLKCIDPV